MIGFIRSLFESALKTNPYLEFAVITGCLRISKESLFTGLNNLKVISLLNNNFGEYFGFVQEEGDEMLDYYGVAKRREDLKAWSDGFHFGRVSVYNPWSVLSSVDELKKYVDDFLKPQWANTSSNSIVKTLVEGADSETRADIEKLIAGGSVEKPIHEEITYSEMKKNGDNLWNFLFFTGYLTLKGLRQQGIHLLAELCLPNLEVLYIYVTIINDWLDDRSENRGLPILHKAIIRGDIEQVTSILQDSLLDTISFFDYRESYYHGFLAGLLSGTAKYSLRSNHESGSGRLDLALIPSNKTEAVIIIELKVCDDEDELELQAVAALSQIKDRNYQAEWRRYSRFLLYGIAFCKKDVYIVTQSEQATLQKGKPPTVDKSRSNFALYSGINCTLAEINVLNFLKENPSATYDDIARATGKSTRTAQTLVRSLKSKRLLIRERARSGRWTVGGVK
jgi:hypothetical protein